MRDKLTAAQQCIQLFILCALLLCPCWLSFWLTYPSLSGHFINNSYLIHSLILLETLNLALTLAPLLQTPTLQFHSVSTLLQTLLSSQKQYTLKGRVSHKVASWCKSKNTRTTFMLWTQNLYDYFLQISRTWSTMLNKRGAFFIHPVDIRLHCFLSNKHSINNMNTFTFVRNRLGIKTRLKFRQSTFSSPFDVTFREENPKDKNQSLYIRH